MNCNNTTNPLKKIVLFLIITIGIGAVTYFIFVITRNPAIAAPIPLILSFAACPLMCGVMGGLMVMMNRSKKKKEIKKERINALKQISDQQLEEHKQSVSEHSQNVRGKTSIE